MDNNFLLVDRPEPGIVTVTVNRPDQMNALNTALLAEVDRVFSGLADDDSVRVVILTGAGKAFVAGADIREMADFTAAQARRFSSLGQKAFSAVENFPRPVIAAVNGFALGGGCELAMACDIRIAGEKAKFGQPEVNLGVTPGFGGTQRLPRLVGRARAKQLLFTGEMVNAEKAVLIGLAEEVTPQDGLMGRCLELARLIAAKGPIAVALAKAAVNEGIDADLHRGMAYETGVFAQTFATADQKEGMRAFVEKRPAQFRNE